MPTLKEAKDKVRELAAHGLAVAESTTMTYAQKKSALDKLDPDLKFWVSEVKDLEVVEKKRTAFLAAGPMLTEFVGGYTEQHFGAVGKSAAPGIRPNLDQLQQLHAATKSHSNYRVELKDSTDLGPLIPSTLVPGILSPIHEPTRIADYFPGAAMNGPSIEYLQHQSTTGVPTTVLPGGLKPPLSFVDVQMTLRASKIAATITLNDESLQDFPNYLSYVGSELQRLYTDAENLQLLSGTGVAPDMTGLLVTSGILVRPVAADTGLDALERAGLDLRNGPSYTEPTLYILNPTNWSALRRSKDSQGRYLLNADPAAAEANTLWGKTVVTTTAMPAGTALALNASLAATLWVRQGVVIETSNAASDDFEHNKTTTRIEARVALAVTRPTAIVKITGLAS